MLGADTYSPAPIEQTHPDLFWYGIHGVETLFTVMGTGCKSVVRVFTDRTDIVVGRWNDNRTGTFRGIRAGKSGYGGTVFGETGIEVLGGYAGYDPLLKGIVGFFPSGIPPVERKRRSKSSPSWRRPKRANGGRSIGRTRDRTAPGAQRDGCEHVGCGPRRWRARPTPFVARREYVRSEVARIGG